MNYIFLNLRRIFISLMLVVCMSFSLASIVLGYPAPEIDGCDETQTDSIKKAYKKMTKTVDNSSCLPKDIKDKVKEKLNETITIQCTDSAFTCCSKPLLICKDPDTCGLGIPLRKTVWLCKEDGYCFDEAACGCLEALLLHEVLHTAGYPGEKIPYACAESCFPDCANTDPKYPACECK